MNKYSPQRKIPDFHRKRLVHLLSCGVLAVNLLVFAILLPDVRAWTLGVAAVTVAHAVLLLFDRRKSEWAWWCMVFEAVVAVGILLGYVLLFELYFYIAVLGAQVVGSAALLAAFNKK